MLRCKEIWVVGAGRYRNPDDDLPRDFEARRVNYYRELRKPLDPAVFSGSLRREMTTTLQDQIEQGLNVVESWNRANAIICYGKSGEISTNRKEEVEMTALCLRILQASLVFVNTLMLQEILAEPELSALLTPANWRGLSPLF